MISAGLAAALVELVLAGLQREYPSGIWLHLSGPADLRLPRERTPVFYGCYDWHSAVHGHWTLARLLRLFPAAAWAERVQAVLARSLDPAAIRIETEHLRRSPGFECPYGIAWLLTLALELPPGLRARLTPLERQADLNFRRWLGRLSHPIRSGQHDQSAFSFGLVLDWARAVGAADLAARIADRAWAFHGGDRAGPLAYEPSAHDFLSPCLAEAELLSQLLPQAEFAAWLTGFLPDPRLEPVTAVDSSDGRLSHFDGLNLSRAWMLARIAHALPPDDGRRPALQQQAQQHGERGEAALTAEAYASAHWLGTFVLRWRTWGLAPGHQAPAGVPDPGD